MKSLFLWLWQKIKPRFWTWVQPKIPDRQISGIGRPYFYYREGDYVAGISAEWFTTAPILSIYISSLTTWMPPLDREFIPPEKRREIQEHLIAFLAKRKWSYDIQESEKEVARIRTAIEKGERIFW